MLTDKFVIVHWQRNYRMTFVKGWKIYDSSESTDVTKKPNLENNKRNLADSLVSFRIVERIFENKTGDQKLIPPKILIVTVPEKEIIKFTPKTEYHFNTLRDWRSICPQPNV